MRLMRQPDVAARRAKIGIGGGVIQHSQLAEQPGFGATLQNPSSAMLERVDKIGTEVSHIGHIARRERHAMNFGCRREQGIHG